jgi:hypothetical protein
VIAAPPRYLVKDPQITEPTNLAHHQMISMTHFGGDSWSFAPANQSAVPRVMQFTPLPKWKSSAMATSSISPQVLSITLAPHALARTRAPPDQATAVVVATGSPDVLPETAVLD